jgi:hypothetical protein
MLRGSRCLVRFQVGPQENQALTSFFSRSAFFNYTRFAQKQVYRKLANSKIGYWLNFLIFNYVLLLYFAKSIFKQILYRNNSKTC